MTPTWYGRPIAKETHKNDLEHHAAMLEFGEGYPRKQAEEAAYGAYMREHHQQASAHHLRGMRAAQASGDLSEANLHGEAYHHHMTNLGHDSLDQVPPEIHALTEAEDRHTHYKFKAHPADRLLNQEPSVSENSDNLSPEQPPKE